MDWSDSAEDWSDSAYRWSGTDLIPYVAYSRLERGDQDIFSVRSARWTGSTWSRSMIVDQLLSEPDAVVALRTVGGNTELVHALHHHDGDGSLLAWVPWNVVTGAVGLVRTLADVNKKFGRPTLAIRTAEGDPAFAFERDEAGAMQDGTWFVRWNSGLVPPAFTNLEQVQACNLGHPSLALDPQNDDRWRITCLNRVNAVRTDVKYVVRAANINDPPEVEEPFAGNGCPAPTIWSAPDMAFVDGEPIIAAVDVPLMRIWVSRRQGPNTWACSLVTATNTVAVSDISIAVLPDPGTNDIIGVLHAGNTVGGTSAVQYTERSPNGLWLPRRVDRNGTSQCAFINRSVDLEYPDQETVVANWTQERALRTSRWTRWERDDLRGHTRLLNTGQHHAASLALDDNGEPVTCFFLEGPAIPPQAPQVDLFMRFGQQAPVLVAANQGMPLDLRARGCDVAVAPDGRTGVLWTDTTNNRLRYVEVVNGVLGFIDDVKDNGVVVAGNPHLAVAFNAFSLPSLVVSRLDAGGVARPWVARRLANMWDFDQLLSPAEGGLYPDITFSAFSGTWERISMFGKHNGDFRAWFISRTGAGWAAAKAVSPPNEGWDTKIATRAIGTIEQLVIAWYDFSGDRARFARLQGGLFLGDVSDPGPLTGQFVGLDIDAFGQPVFTWRHGVLSAEAVVRTARVSPFETRVPPALPVKGIERCDLAPGDQGTDLVLDAFDNLRIEHKESEGHNGQEDRLFFLPRP